MDESSRVSTLSDGSGAGSEVHQFNLTEFLEDVKVEVEAAFIPETHSNSMAPPSPTNQSAFTISPSSGSAASSPATPSAPEGQKRRHPHQFKGQQNINRI